MPNLPLETQVFVIVIVVGAIFSHFRFSEKTAHDAPGILITIGIFATFFGIAVGLYGFDMNNVESSLPRLIGGIKLAFWASVVGVGAALTLKIRYAFYGSTDKPDSVSEGATIDDLLLQQRAATEATNKLHQALVGGEDASLLTQLKLIRTDQNDRLEAVRKEFAEFAKKQAENNTRALIDALREVIKDFNEKIHEQFGENFKQLNQAVGKINEWQEMYRQQMGEMIQQQKQTAAHMAMAGKAFQEVVTQASSFAATAEALRGTLETMGVVEKALQAELVALSQLVESAKTGIPTIERKVSEIVTAVGNGARESAEVISAQVSQSSKVMTDAVKHQADAMDATVKQTASIIQQHVTDLNATVAAAANRMSQDITKQNNLVSEHIESLAESTQKHMASVSADLSKAILRHNEQISKDVSEMSSRVKEQVVVLDTELSKSLTTSLESLGRQLSALSGKFVSDYGQLSEQFTRLVQLIKQLERS